MRNTLRVGKCDSIVGDGERIKGSVTSACPVG